MRKMLWAFAGLTVVICNLPALAQSTAPPPSAPVAGSIPRLGSRDFGWNANFWDFQLDPPQGSAHGPIKTDPNYPYNSQIQNGGFFARWGAPARDREHEGSDLETLGRGAHAGNE